MQIVSWNVEVPHKRKEPLAEYVLIKHDAFKNLFLFQIFKFDA